MTASRISIRQGLTALSPALLFLLLYVAVSLVIGDFYVMPITVALLAASAWGIVIDRTGGTLHQRIEYFSHSAGHSNILYMVWIFVMAGAFASLAKGIGAIDATVELTLSLFPSHLILPAIFMAACFISLAIGTSVGTIVAIVPLVVELATEGGGNIALFVATALGGAFFGDNLSFISDTTIASTRSQGCDMSDKFRANIRIALPAALLTLCIYLFQTFDAKPTSLPVDVSASWLVLPYLIVVVTAVARINVTIVLSLGILSALVMGLFIGYTPVAMAGFMGAGAVAAAGAEAASGTWKDKGRERRMPKPYGTGASERVVAYGS